MYQTISNIKESVHLKDYIDNINNTKKVGLKSFTYTLGWYNIKNVNVEIIGGDEYEIPPGYYNFNDLSDYLEDIGITLDLNEKNGITTITLTNDVKLSLNLKNILGLPK